MTSDSTTLLIRLPKSIKVAAEKLVQSDGISMHQFVAAAVAEKLAVVPREGDKNV
jgi:hypothetical protein